MLCAALVLVTACQKVERSTPGVAGGSTPHARELEIVDANGLEMLLIPAGPFLMGSDRGEPDQGPLREVSIDAFLMDRYEVTQEVFKTGGLQCRK